MKQPADPYLLGLRLLAMREFSTARLADRLRRRGIASADVDAALARLRRDGALDDARAARSFADTFLQRGRGRRRVQRDLEAQGIDPELAADVVAERFDSVDERALMRELIARRLSGPLADRAELERLHRYLVRRGFPSDEALAVLRSWRGPAADSAN